MWWVALIYMSVAVSFSRVSFFGCPFGIL